MELLVGFFAVPAHYAAGAVILGLYHLITRKPEPVAPPPPTSYSEQLVQKIHTLTASILNQSPLLTTIEAMLLIGVGTAAWRFWPCTPPPNPYVGLPSSDNTLDTQRQGIVLHGEYAILNEIIYGEQHLDHCPRNWSMRWFAEQFHCKSPSYDAFAFINEVSHNIVIVHKAWMADNPATQSHELQDYAGKFAAQIRKKIANSYQDYRLSHTGSTFGGTVAQFIAYFGKEEAVVFEPTGACGLVTQEMRNPYNLHPQIDGGLCQRLMISYFNNRNPLNTLDDQIGLLLRLEADRSPPLTFWKQIAWTLGTARHREWDLITRLTAPLRQTLKNKEPRKHLRPVTKWPPKCGSWNEFHSGKNQGVMEDPGLEGAFSVKWLTPEAYRLLTSQNYPNHSVLSLIAWDPDQDTQVTVKQTGRGPLGIPEIVSFVNRELGAAKQEH
ncbi:MAG: hypothetical protein AB7F31_02225 [Parachlamydiales bacterium]